MADAIEIFTSSASERIEVVTSGAQGPKGDAGGATYDQSLNTTDSVQFASVAVGTDLRINGALNEIYFGADGSGGVIGFEEQIIRSGSNYVLSWSAEATYHYVPLEFPSPATAATTRTNLGLGTAATSNVGDFAQIEGSPSFAEINFPWGSRIYENGGNLTITTGEDAPYSNYPIYLTSTGGCFVSPSAPIGWMTSGFKLYNTGNLLQFVGTTSSFPALKRSFAALQARLADDSAFANFSAATGSFTGLSLSAGTLTASTPFDFSQTWNNSAVTFTGLKLNVTDTASAAASLLMDLQVGGNSAIRVTKQGKWYGHKDSPNYFWQDDANTFSFANGPSWSNTPTVSIRPNYATLLVSNVGQIGFTNSTSSNAAAASVLSTDGSGIIAQRNGANAQTFRIYNTYTDASNYERGFLRWSSNVLQLGTEAGGTGVQRQLQFSLGTVAADTPLLVTQTWNNSAVTFTGLKLNVTDTASNAASLLMDLQVGGVSKLAIDKTGLLKVVSASSFTANKWSIDSNGSSRFAGATQMIDSNGYTFPANTGPRWSNLDYDPTGTIDLKLYRDAAGTLAQRNGTNAQESRVYATYTSATNYQRGTVKCIKQTLSALSGASATTTGTFIPDGAVVVGVTTRVGTAITGATSYSVGDGSDVDRWGGSIAVALNTTSDNRDWTAGTVECFTSGGNVTLTANGSNFTGGAVEICVFYLAGEAD